jgi:hypothetical protein
VTKDKKSKKKKEEEPVKKGGDDEFVCVGIWLRQSVRSD